MKGKISAVFPEKFRDFWETGHWWVHSTLFARALLNTGTEWSGTDYTGMSRNIPERERITSEWNGMDKNGTGMYRNEPEWHRNILKWAGMRLEWTRIWSAEPGKGKMWYFSFPFFFSFNGDWGGISRHFREQCCFILTGLSCNDQSKWSWAHVSKP